MCITRGTAEPEGEAAGGPAPDLTRRWPFFLGGGLLLWVNWQVSTIVGVLIGPTLPDSLPLDFAIPLVFLVLLIPTITTRPAAVAASVGGLAAVLSEQAGVGHLSVLVGSLAGIAAGALAEGNADRGDPGAAVSAPPEPGLDV
jgi:predicted branched-subunit amino acid permease